MRVSLTHARGALGDGPENLVDGVKPISDGLRFVCDSPDDPLRYEVSFNRRTTLLVSPFLDQAISSPVLRHAVGKVTGMDGAYHRFTGDAQVTVTDGDRIVEQHTSPSAVGELMYFGKH